MCILNMAVHALEGEPAGQYIQSPFTSKGPNPGSKYFRATKAQVAQHRHAISNWCKWAHLAVFCRALIADARHIPEWPSLLTLIADLAKLTNTYQH